VTAQVWLRLDELSDAERTLVEAATEASKRAYARYSGYRVGAAVRGASGRIYVGCNVENASYGATLCAERSAVSALVASGEHELTAVSVFTATLPLAMPCGICRQVIAEFCRDAQVLVAGPDGALRRSFADLLPEAFLLKPDGEA